MAEIRPILLIGAGRMGGSIVHGWSRKDAFDPNDLILCDPSPSWEAQEAGRQGAALNPPDDSLQRAQTVILAVKPQVWRQAAARYAPLLAPDAVIASIVVGVRLKDIAEAFGGRRVVRVMPTTGVAIARGVASIYAEDSQTRERGHALFDPIATTADLDDEDLMDAAAAVSGSGPAYLYAFVEALEAAGEGAGLPAEVARTLARATVIGAAALLDETGEEPAELRRQVTSPGGTTLAALGVLMGERGLDPLMREAVAANIARARELAK